MMCTSTSHSSLGISSIYIMYLIKHLQHICSMHWWGLLDFKCHVTQPHQGRVSYLRCIFHTFLMLSFCTPLILTFISKTIYLHLCTRQLEKRWQKDLWDWKDPNTMSWMGGGGASNRVSSLKTQKNNEKKSFARELKNKRVTCSPRTPTSGVCT